MKKTPSMIKALAAVALLGISSPLSFAAGTDTWVGSTDANWNTAGNWTTSGGSTPPANGDSLVFGAAGSSGLSLNNNISGLTVNKLTFNSGASSFTFGGNTFTLGGGIDASALTSGTMTFPATTAIGNGFQRWNVGSGATLAFGRLGSGADAQDLYTPNGAVTILSGAGTKTTTTADGWGWRGGSVSGTGPLGPGMVIDNGNNTYDWASVGTQTAGTSHAIVAATYTTAPNASDSHNVLVTGNTSVSENNSWASLLVSNATLTISGTLLNLDTGIILENGGTVAGSKPIRSDNTDGLYIYVPDSGTISTAIADNGVKKLYKSGRGTLTLSGANTYTGSTVIYEGTLQMNSFNASSASVIVNNGCILALNFGDALGYTASKNVPTINSGGTITNIMSAGRVTLWNGLTMTGGTLTGASTVADVNGEYSLSGTVTATSDANGTAATISGTPISLQNQNVANGTVTFNVTRGSATPASDLNVTANLVPNSGAANVGVAKSGTGIMTLSGTNTLGNVLNVTAGSLVISGTTTVNAGSVANSGYLNMPGTVGLTIPAGGSLSILGTLNATVPGSIVRPERRRNEHADGKWRLVVNRREHGLRSRQQRQHRHRRADDYQ